MSAAIITAEGLVVLALLWALLAGQPAANQSNLERISAQATEIVSLRAALPVRPTPTPYARYCLVYQLC